MSVIAEPVEESSIVNKEALFLSSGAGGREASLFTADIYQMYQK